jgi:CubicO group peptidase (beta-lactamase class C family)
VRQILAHASDASKAFKYDPARFAALVAVAEACGNKRLRVGAADAVLERLGMTASVPGADLADASNPDREQFDDTRLQRYGDVVRRMALPYRVDRNNGRATRMDIVAQPLDAATGLVSTVRDLARFDAALDDAVLLRAGTLTTAWTPADFGNGPLPTGLGWFVQNYQGERLIWQFSQASDAYSAIILKVPSRHLTLILLANSNGLASGVELEKGDVTVSPFVKIFLRLFVS